MLYEILRISINQEKCDASNSKNFKMKCLSEISYYNLLPIQEPAPKNTFTLGNGPVLR